MLSRLGVRVGEHVISTQIDCEIDNDGTQKCSKYPVQDLGVEDVIIHPEFSKDIILNDIGLVRVTKMNLAVVNVRPVCLPTSEDTRTATFNFCVVTGWGFTESYGVSADILQLVTLNMMNLTRCKAVYKGEPRVNITYKQLCAGGEKDNKDSCPGDSGGPMQVASYINDEIRYVQQGIVSFGHRFCGTEGYPGVYTRIAYYMDWVLDNLKP
ncbi:hypothetical protein NQ318_004014 [Aromia moschata]|uniref:Peptidase S1 domain-containing protein n=1 Tax=Aromia moschata TaxID=1265417 RepID=A0AAV8Z912_9CUCU|nr:hypothetical protein NQ318_004014 [Aromia moschata]